MGNIIRKAHNVEVKMTSTFKKMAQVFEDLRVCAVSVLWHSARHRNPTLMNTFVNALDKPLQAAFKRWFAEECMKALEPLVPMPRVSDIPFTVKSKEGSYTISVKKGEVNLTDCIADYVERFDNDPQYGKFFKKDVEKTADPFNSLSIMKALEGLLKKAEKDDAEVTLHAKEALAEAVHIFRTRAKDDMLSDEAKVKLREKTEEAARNAVKEARNTPRVLALPPPTAVVGEEVVLH